MTSRLDDSPEQLRRLHAIFQAVRRRPGLRAAVHHLDRLDGVGQGLIVDVRAKLDDRRLDRQRSRDMVAEELAGADDKVQSPRIKARGTPTV